MLLETHDPAWSHSAHAVALLHATDHQAVGILYDVLHPYRMGEDVTQTIATLAPYIQLVHLKDGKRPAASSPEWPLCPLGAGDVPLAAVYSTLRARGYDGWYTFEWEKHWHPQLAEPEVALPAGLRYLRSLVGAA